MHLALCTLLAASLFFPMEPDHNYITEQNSGRQYFVEGSNYAAAVDGVEGKALRLDGYSNYVEVNLSRYTMSDSMLTVSFVTAVESYPMMAIDGTQDTWTELISTLSDADRSGWAFSLSSNGHYSFQAYIGGSNSACYGSARFPLQQWTHVAATVDIAARKMSLYINGELVQTANLGGGTLKQGKQTLLIGKGRQEITYAGANLNTMNGILDCLHIDSRVWTEDEIRSVRTDAPLCLADHDTIFVNNYYRPRFHAMPAMNWTNECHGLIYSGGRYHLFFQKNGNGPYMSRLNWGHLSSADLCHWQEEKIALTPMASYDNKGCWSGCVFTDEKLTAGQPRILYTAVNSAKASIAQAMPQDGELLDWEKDANGPIIAGTPAGYEADFRDPYFFRNGEDAYIIVGTRKNGTGANTLHRYQDGQWQHVGTFMQATDAGLYGTFNEMTNVTRMLNGKWLVTATPLGGNNGVRTIYWTGSINPDGTFSRDAQSDRPRTFEMEGTSKWGYGLLSPSIYNDGDKTLAIGIVPDKLATYYNVTRLSYAHTMSLPREIWLDEQNNLCQKPYSGLTALRGEEHFSAADTTINGTLSLEPVQGRQWEVRMRAVVGDNPFRLNFLEQGYQMAKLTYTPATGKLLVTLAIDRINNDGNNFNGNYEMQLPVVPAVGDTLLLDVYFDNSILEIFVNERWASSIRVFCQTYNADGLSLTTTGDVRFASIDAWSLGSNTHYHPWTTPQRDPSREPQEPEGLRNAEETPQARKMLTPDGQLIIISNGKIYNALGQIKDNR